MTTNDYLHLRARADTRSLNSHLVCASHGTFAPRLPVRVIFGIVASLRDGGEFVSKALSVQDCEFANLSCFEQTTPLRRASFSASNAFTPARIDWKITQKRAYHSEIHYSHSPRCACGETCLGSWSRSSHSRCRRKRAGGKQGGIASFKNFD